MGRLASNDSRRGARAARGGEVNAGRSEDASTCAPTRTLAVLLCALALLASTALQLRAQSGRKSAPPSTQGRAAAPTPTPTPPVNSLVGPIAEPPPRDKTSNPPRRATTTVSPSSQGASEGAARGAEEVGGEEVVRISSNLVPVPASVVDVRGRAVTDLKAEDFELRVDGQLKPIGDLSRSETPVSIAILYDNSASLNATREFERQAGIRFLKSVMRPVDRAAVYSISTTPELAQPLTNDVRALVRTIERFGKPRGATALFDTIAAAADYLQPQKARKVILIISDGTDTMSGLDFDTTMARVLIDNCQVYSIRLGYSDNANLRDLAGERRLQEFAAQTGGTSYSARSRVDFDEAFTQIAADLSQQYVLSYYPSTADPRDGRFRTFTLNVKTRQGLRVRTRKGYYAPKG
ncbi:MAG: hypothetical protein DMF67_00090 [Acidobacteria bacterium]|nr:MAG: hypothetical protein DMF67_00090 [Acidobacteriota bacterium]